MSTATGTEHQSPSTEGTTRDRVTVAVGEADKAADAVTWAATEAARLGLPLQLVAAVPVIPNPAPFRPPKQRTAELEVDAKQRELRDLAERLPADLEVLSPVVGIGPPMHVLLEQVDDHTRLLVLGHRELRAAQRVLTGSTSIALSGRSPVPVAVVPDGWDPAAHTSEPVVVGVDLRHTDDGPDADDEVLDNAFARADGLGTSLVAVHAWEIPALLGWSPVDIQAHRTEVQAAFEAFLEPWKVRFPGVEVDAYSVAERPADAVLDAAKVAQLVVVGRHTVAHRHGGFHLGSTARMVMHHQTVPVLVVPVPVAASAQEDRETYGDLWSPMF